MTRPRSAVVAGAPRRRADGRLVTGAGVLGRGAGREGRGVPASGYAIDFFGLGRKVAARMGIVPALRRCRVPIKGITAVNERGRPRGELVVGNDESTATARTTTPSTGTGNHTVLGTGRPPSRQQPGDQPRDRSACDDEEHGGTERALRICMAAIVRDGHPLLAGLHGTSGPVPPVRRRLRRTWRSAGAGAP